MARRALHRARDAASGALVVDRLRVADTHWTRLRGLIGTSPLDGGEGLWIRPCRQVHMFWMGYAIDVVFLDDAHRIVGLTPELRPWRISPLVKAATSVIELAAGTIAALGLAEGRTLTIEPRSPSAG